MNFSERTEWEFLESVGLMDLRGCLSFLGAMVAWILQIPWVEWLGMELSPLINLIWKSKLLKTACHLAKICLEAIFLTSFCKTDFADLQSTLNKNS